MNVTPKRKKKLLTHLEMTVLVELTIKFTNSLTPYTVSSGHVNKGALLRETLAPKSIHCMIK